ncbi:flagellar biosynthetic protein FliR [Hyphococcus sp.]|jgi:flagellar biosynthetic protein FliR|uniref:flagellar biosynthetic protein FliR n=1 Tax=Hyphococcus sp. TaxID=2038636 RepID=UPI003D0C58AD
MSYEISIEPVYGFMLILARVGAIIMLMPGIGESWIPARARLLLALAVSGVLYAGKSSGLQFDTSDFGAYASAVIAETATGLIFGGAMRLFLAAPVIAGQITSQLTSISNIFVPAGMSLEANSVLGVWFYMGALMFIFVSGLHYFMLDAISSSYAVIAVGELPHLGDAAKHIITVFAGVFILGVQMAAPFVLLSLVFNLGVGLTNKMLATLPLYFVAMPMSILGGLYVLAFAVAPMLNAFRGVFAAWLAAPFQ